MTGCEPPRTLNQLYRQTRDRLAGALDSGANPGFEAAQLLEHTLGVTRERLLRDGPLPPPPGAAGALEPLLLRRLEGEPLQYILGRWDFYGLPFLVGPGVLIPRPETEMLVELALEAVSGLPAPALLDLCSGSGCIPIAFGKHRPDATATGVELSPRAMEWFQRNIALNGVSNVIALAGDALALPPEAAGRRWHVVTSNPPYIPSGQLEGLPREVLREPELALDGGTDGLDFYRRLPGLCRSLLAPGGLMLLEIGEDQGETVPCLLEAAGYREVTLLRDPAGHPRVVWGRV